MERWTGETEEGCEYHFEAIKALNRQVNEKLRFLEDQSGGI